MKKNFYLQHSLMAMHDPRMQQLVESETLKGLGAYWFIIEKLALLPEPYANLEYLQPFCSKASKVTLAYLKKVIWEYQLFTIEVNGYFMPKELNPVRKKDKISSENHQKMPENQAKSDENRSKNDEKREKVSDKTDTKSLNKSHLPQNNTYTDKGNIKDIITTASAKEEETATATISSGLKPAGNVQEPSASSAPFSLCDENGDPQLPPHSIQPWETLVDDLIKDSCWLDIALMKSGYGVMLKRYLKQTISLFKQHIMAYDKGSGLLQMSDVHSYFVNFVQSGSRTSAILRQQLLKIDAAKKKADNADNPYRYERLIDGRRTYMGSLIPPYAPPRPDNTAIWNNQIRCWVSQRRSKDKPS